MAIKARRDKNALTLFDNKNGTKIRLALGKYTKSRLPELVDIKITDYCAFGCTFCYQGSTVEGKHATYENLQLLIKRPAEAQVFEIAAGGGEPTDHPDFIRMLKDFHKAGIVPNFTTRSLGWVKRNWVEIEPYIGAFAYSADTIQHLDSAATMFKDIPKERINIHYIMGLQDEDNFITFMKKAHELNFRVTLLGYKTTGRGKNIIPIKYDWWLDSVNILLSMGVCPTFSIDTPLAEQYANELPVAKEMFHTREGFVSAYIDAVSMQMGASSFDEKEILVPFDDDWVNRYRYL